MRDGGYILLNFVYRQDVTEGEEVAVGRGQVHSRVASFVWAWPPRLPRAATRYPGQFSAGPVWHPWGLYPQKRSVDLLDFFVGERLKSTLLFFLLFEGLEHHFRGWPKFSVHDVSDKPLFVVSGGLTSEIGPFSNIDDWAISLDLKTLHPYLTLASDFSVEKFEAIDAQFDEYISGVGTSRFHHVAIS